MENRINYYDLLRGLAIIGVIAIHSTGIGYKALDTSFAFNLTVLWRQIINFSVPIFITISGFFLGNKNVSTKDEYLQFIKKQIPRVLIPYLIWSILYLGIAFAKGANLQSLIYRLFTFQSIVPFYFIILIIEYYLLLPVLKKMASVKGLLFSASISALSCFLIFYFRYFTDINLPSYVTGSAPSWLIFFVLGIYLRNNKITIKNISLIILIVLGLTLSLLETYALYYSFNSIEDSVTAVKLSSFIYSFFLIILVFKNSDKEYFKSKVFVYIGEISFGIYLSHMLFMIVIESLLDELFPGINNYTILKQFTLIFAVLSASIIFATIARKLNKKKAVKYLGQ